MYCDRTGRGTRPGYYPNRSGRVPKTSEDTTVRRVPGMPFGNATDIRHTLPPEPHERHVGKSFFEHIGRESGDIAKYATNPAGVRKPGDRNRFTALMWNKGYIPATEDACIVQDEVSPGPQKYHLDQFPIHPNSTHAIYPWEHDIKVRPLQTVCRAE